MILKEQAIRSKWWCLSTKLHDATPRHISSQRPPRLSQSLTRISFRPVYQGKGLQWITLPNQLQPRNASHAAPKYYHDNHCQVKCSCCCLAVCSVTASNTQVQVLIRTTNDVKKCAVNLGGRQTMNKTSLAYLSAEQLTLDDVPHQSEEAQNIITLQTDTLIPRWRLATLLHTFNSTCIKILATVTGDKKKIRVKSEREQIINKKCILCNQRDSTYTVFFIIISALHVPGGFSAHHQELIKLYVQPWVLSWFPAVCRWCSA